MPLLSQASGDPTPHANRQLLIGTWKLLRIEYTGSNGSHVDPYYQADSTGLLIYDESGWMSVHIAAPNRRPWEPAVSRLPADQAANGALKIAAFDSYYAYYGTWDFNESASVVTHHVVDSLIPFEDGANFAQVVSFEEGRLVFTVRSVERGAATVRRKVWERVARP
jgi:hypothetical protein